jgi:hypothetical protein
MCTVTVVPYDDGFRLVCNRDERLDRPAAIPPMDVIRQRTAIYPQDPLGGGTWIGINDAGLAVALLNMNIDAAQPGDERPLRSRGLIIPRLLDARATAEAVDMAADLNPAQCKPFRLLVLQRMTAALMTSDGLTLSLQTPSLSQPLMLTSSSLGDALVEPPRRRLFEQLMMNNGRGWLHAQADFHDHQWPLRPDLSVRMQRPDVRTVSRTIVNVTGRGIDLHYTALAERPAGGTA